MCLRGFCKVIKTVCGQLVVMVLLLLVGGCGISSDNVNGSHKEVKTTYRNISSVMSGNVVGGGEGDTVVLNSSQPVYMYGNFTLRDLNAVSVANGIPVYARLKNGEELSSFLQGVPCRRADITIIQSDDWHKVTGTAIAVQTPDSTTLSAESTVSINPFTNLAYWLSTTETYRSAAPTAFAAYTSARNSMNVSLGLSQCKVEKGLCKDQLVFLKKGFIRADSNYFSYSSHRRCSHYIARFPSCTSVRLGNR